MNTRHFTVKGVIDCLFSPSTGDVIDTLAGIEVQLWQQVPMHSVFLGKGITNSDGEYTIEFDLESPVSNINDGKLTDVFIKPYLYGELLTIAYDTDAKAYFDLLSPQPSDAFKTAINDLVVQLKADGNWTKLDRFWIHATEQQQHATISLVNPGSTPLEEVNSPAWTASLGYTGNGYSSYLRTHFNPTTDGVQFTLNSASLGVYSRTDSAIDAFDIASYDGNHNYVTLKWSDTNMYGSINCSTDPGISVADSLGLTLASRTNSTDVKMGKNGVVLSTLTASSSALVNLEMYLLCRNGFGYPSYFSTRQVSFTLIGGGDIDHASFYSAVQDFATVIGFNV